MVTGTNRTPLTFQKISFRVDQLIPGRVCASVENQLPTKFGGKIGTQFLRLSLTKSGPTEVAKAYKISWIVTLLLALIWIFIQNT